MFAASLVQRVAPQAPSVFRETAMLLLPHGESGARYFLWTPFAQKQ
ncbi:hypothetical protein A1F94_001579 [Pyrenophora tritici-repentis]|nr:hypothetical protein A1F94_001579 [Pyrenophora tritici-repentis]KAI1673935.1 hypothetical protein L13192_00682 [Pyrenophora tritici-repentis]KAI1688974.1 hypothetical protein KJE20_02152 [Pyrenophora tritici-repentis]